MFRFGCLRNSTEYNPNFSEGPKKTLLRIG
jgi:hypothetical protein